MQKTTKEKTQSKSIPISALIVNDNLFQRKLMRFQLEKEGFSVAEAKDGQEAIDFIQNGNIPSIIIADIDMPRLNGWELLKFIRNSPQKAIQEIPFIVVSAFYSKDEARLLGQSLGANATIPIPYNPKILLNSINECLQKTQLPEKGNVLLKIASSYKNWERAFKTNNFKIITKGKAQEEPVAVIVEVKEPKEVEQIKEQYPKALIIALTKDATSNPLDFLAKGARYVFDIQTDPSYVSLVVMRELEQHATEVAYKILKARTTDVDLLGIDRRFKEGDLSKLFFNLNWFLDV